MRRPRLLDLFCGAGGAAMGYHRAGLDVVGVDIEPQPNYPFEFMQADALDVLHPRFHSWIHPGGFDAIHASPPCQAYSFSTLQHRKTRTYPDLIAETRRLIVACSLPWVIENVPGAPMGASITLCGSTLGLDRIKRHRHFETSWPMMSPGCNHSILREPLTVAGHNEQGRTYADRTLPHGLAARKEAMGIDWMTRDELTEAIPPAFTEYIGRELLRVLAADGPSGAGTPASARDGSLRHDGLLSTGTDTVAVTTDSFAGAEREILSTGSPRPAPAGVHRRTHNAQEEPK